MQDSNLDILKIQDERICREKSLFCPSPLYVYIYIYIYTCCFRARDLRGTALFTVDTT